MAGDARKEFGHYPWLLLGVVTGTVLLSIIRTLYYFAIDRQPEMSPMMFIVFAPIVALPFILVAVITELLVRWLPQSKHSSRPWSFLIGASYTSPLFGLIDT